MNPTIDLQLNHRSIRKFKNKEIPKEIIDLLIDVAQHTATSNYAQSYSIINVTNPIKKKKIAEIGRQPYIETAPCIFIMVADQRRNSKLVLSEKEDIKIFSSFEKFFLAATDAILASQNIMLAAESIGLKGVFLGSILNQIDQLVSLLDIPKLAVPVLGIALGYPDENPSLKPRLPKNLIYFENSYKESDNIIDELKKYDSIINNYYTSRLTNNKKINSFQEMITNWSLSTYEGRLKMLEYIKKQDLIKY